MAKKIISIFLIITSLYLNINAQTLTIHITGINNKKGNIILAFFNNDNDFKAEKTIYEKVVNKDNLKNGSITVSYSDIKPGEYGIALLDDVDKNGDMTYSFLCPQEGFGFSNYYHKGLKKPSFDKFKFQFNSNLTVNIRVKYI